MKKWTLSAKILSVSILILLIFSVASFGILFRALSNQSSREMEQLLANEMLALSSLVNSTLSGGFEFEMHSHFLSQYHQRNPDGFFRFVDRQTGKVLKESLGAPGIPCNLEEDDTDYEIDGQTFKIETAVFTPELDAEQEAPPSAFQGQPICLIAGKNRAPYWLLVKETLLSSIPILISIVLILVGLLLLLIRRLTKDLQALTAALAVVNLGGSYKFPDLPRAHTQEVAAIIDVLESLHRQATEIYREMWLFMGRAAHQIKTPLTGIQATLEVLLRKDRTKEELLSGLQDVKSATAHLNGLTQKLITSSRISFQSVPPLEPIDLGIFLRELLDLFKTKGQECGVALKVAESPNVKVIGNKILMSDIFGNLIENAILYSAGAGSSEVHVSWSINSQDVQIEVLDQGLGFPESIRSDLFRPFVRGDERTVAGSGLGLSIAKKSVDLLGGELKLSKSSAAGSTMQVVLPIAR